MSIVRTNFNNFTGGIGSELRINTDVPLFSHLWNWKKTEDRLIQLYGFKEVGPPGHIIPFSPIGIVDNPDLDPECRPYELENHSFWIFSEDCTVRLVTLNCPISTSDPIPLGEGELEMCVVPVFYNGCFIYQKDGKVMSFPFFDLANNPVAEEVFPGVEFSNETCFYEHPADNKLYVISGCEMCVLRKGTPGKGQVGNDPYADCRPLPNEYAMLGDRDGFPGTYTPGSFLGPFTETITYISQLQRLLAKMGYYSGPIDGVYGTLVEAAVTAFQLANVTKGNFEGVTDVSGNIGQSPGDPLDPDGIVGPETLSALNCVDSNVAETYCGAITFPFRINYVTGWNGYLALFVKGINGETNMYLWDRSLDANGNGDIGLYGPISLGQGVVQLAHVNQGQMMVIMTPASTAKCISKYDELVIWRINLNETISQGIRDVIGTPQVIARYCLRILGEDSGEEADKACLNYINKKVVSQNGRLYFTGRLHLQCMDDSLDDPNAMSGIWSLGIDGRLCFEAAKTNKEECFTDNCYISFHPFDDGFALSSEDATCVNSHEETDTVSGLITHIIDGDQPWEGKLLKEINLHTNFMDDVDSVEIWIREPNRSCEEDAGWELVCEATDETDEDGTFDSRFFTECISAFRFEDGTYFYEMKEFQLMIKFFGVCGELTNIMVEYEICDYN